MLAVITVTSLADNLFLGDGVSLREAILAANTNAAVSDAPAGDAGADTIRFATALAGKTINLAAELQITEALTIDATALTQNVTIDANNASRIFNITATSGNFTLAGLTLTGGRTTGDHASSNDTTFNGGAVLSLTSGNLTIDQSTVSGNSTTGNFADGGGIFGSGAVTLTSSTVSGNSTTGSGAYGGGIHSSGGVTLTSSTVSGNSTAGSTARGGGILSFGGVTLTSSTVSGNSTAGEHADGGGVFSFGDLTLTSSTVSGNSVAGNFSNSGGIRTGIDTITITNSILAGNTGGGGSPDINPSSGTFSVNFSLLGTAVTPDAGGSGNVFNNNPLLGPLAAYGGPTETHSLLAGSPAINAGDPSFDTGATPNDQRGAPFRRGSGLRVDIGAYERQTVFGLNLTVDTNVDENDGDYSAGDLSLREAVGLANGSFGSLGAQTVRFAASLSGETIELGGTEIVITETLTIDATALAQNVTIDANNSSRIFNIIAATGDFTLAGLKLTGGNALGGGGAIFSSTNGILTIEQSSISGNRTTGNASGGGGIHSAGVLLLNNSTVSGNSTVGKFAEGGGIFSFGPVTLTSSTVSGNRTTGNYASGGGIFSFGTVTLTRSTVTTNQATHLSSGGGGIWSSSTGTTVINHSIISGNSAGGGISDDIRPSTGAFIANFNLFGTFVFPSSGSGNIFNNNPQLGPLANNGGPTKTHAPLVGSPAIDAGDPSIVFNPADFDQRGAPFVRVVGGRIDIGAIETGTTVSSLEGDYDNDGFVGQADLDLVLLNWGKTSPPVPAGWVNQVPAGLIGQAALDGALLHWGDGTPPIATLKSGPSTGDSRQEVSADLIDAVMAMEWLGVASEQDAAVRGSLDPALHPTEGLLNHHSTWRGLETFGRPIDEVGRPAPSAASEVDASRPNANEIEASEEEEFTAALDEVFADLFGGVALR